MTKSTGVDDTTLVCAIVSVTEKSAAIFAQDMKIRRSQVSYNADCGPLHCTPHYASHLVCLSVCPSVPCA